MTTYYMIDIDTIDGSHPGGPSVVLYKTFERAIDELELCIDDPEFVRPNQDEMKRLIEKHREIHYYTEWVGSCARKIYIIRQMTVVD